MERIRIIIKKEGEVILRTSGISCYCLLCGRNLGSIVYLVEESDFNHLDMIPICRPCFDKAGLKMISPDKIHSPYNVPSDSNN